MKDYNAPKIGLGGEFDEVFKRDSIKNSKENMLLINEKFNLETLIHKRANILHSVLAIQKTASIDRYVG